MKTTQDWTEIVARIQKKRGRHKRRSKDYSELTVLIIIAIAAEKAEPGGAQRAHQEWEWDNNERAIELRKKWNFIGKKNTVPKLMQ